MIRTGDHAFVKELNKSIVLGILRTQSPISRTEISKVSGLNKATVSVIMDDLLSANLAIELGHGPSSVGRRPVMCQFNPNAGFSVGLQLDIDGVVGVLTDLAGNVTAKQSVMVESMSVIDQALAAMDHVIHSLLDAASNATLGVLGIGVGVPGLVNYTTGKVLKAPNLSWSDVPLQRMIESQFDYPIFVDNEANTGALAEKLFGKGFGVSDMVYLSVGHGVGAGIIANGQLVRGVHGLAGEFGHMTIETNGIRCSCESKGCLEMYASEKAIVNQYREQAGKTWTISRILEAAGPGDVQAVRAIESAGRYLGIGLSNIANALDTSLIVIGNRLGPGRTAFLHAVQSSFDEYCFSRALSNTRIELSELGPDACAVGAASLVLHEYFSVATVK